MRGPPSSRSRPTFSRCPSRRRGRRRPAPGRAHGAAHGRRRERRQLPAPRVRGAAYAGGAAGCSSTSAVAERSPRAPGSGRPPARGLQRAPTTRPRAPRRHGPRPGAAFHRPAPRRRLAAESRAEAAAGEARPRPAPRPQVAPLSVDTSGPRFRRGTTWRRALPHRAARHSVGATDAGPRSTRIARARCYGGAARCVRARAGAPSQRRPDR